MRLFLCLALCVMVLTPAASHAQAPSQDELKSAASACLLHRNPTRKLPNQTDWIEYPPGYEKCPAVVAAWVKIDAANRAAQAAAANNAKINAAAEALAKSGPPR